MKSSTAETHLDELETMLLHLLYAGEGRDFERTRNVFRPRCLRGSGDMLGQITATESWISEKQSINPITCLSEDRIFATVPELLISPVPDLIGERSESVWYADGKLKWNLIERVDRFPRGICTYGIPRDPKYILHYRETHTSGAEYYIRSAAVWSTRLQKPHLATRYPALLQDKSQLSARNRELRFTFMTSASLEEDSRLFWKVTLTSERSMTVYADRQSIRDLCDLRDNPTSRTGKRRPLLHWVASHTRKSKGGEEIDIRKHLRGITSFELDGTRVKIEPPVFEVQKQSE